MDRSRIENDGKTIAGAGYENRICRITGKVLYQAVVEFQAISWRMCSLKGKYQTVSIMDLHALTEEVNIDIKGFYDQGIRKNPFFTN